MKYLLPVLVLVAGCELDPERAMSIFNVNIGTKIFGGMLFLVLFVSLFWDE